MPDGRHDEGALPVVRIAPLGELKAYTVYEHELDQLAQGSVGSLFLNFGLSLASIFATVLVTLLTVGIPAGRLFQAFFSACLITGIAAAILVAVWWKTYRSATGLVEQIKNRMPPPEGIQEPMSPANPPP